MGNGVLTVVRVAVKWCVAGSVVARVCKPGGQVGGEWCPAGAAAAYVQQGGERVQCLPALSTPGHPRQVNLEDSDQRYSLFGGEQPSGRIQAARP